MLHTGPGLHCTDSKEPGPGLHGTDSKEEPGPGLRFSSSDEVNRGDSPSQLRWKLMSFGQVKS